MTKESLKLALEALYKNTNYSMEGNPIDYQDQRNDDAILAIEEALAQPEPNFAELEKIMLEVWQPVQPEQALQRMTDNAEEMGLYKREWVGLTDEDMDFLFPYGSSVWLQEKVKIIEAKLKEKNNG